MQETVDEMTSLTDWRHIIGVCCLEEEAEKIGRKMAALGLRGMAPGMRREEEAAAHQKGSGTRRCIDRLRNRNLMHIQWPRFIGSPSIHPLSKLGM